ncbi:MAG: hypothetical protein RHS_1643 [Robinsoniella sp. RHS]|uniref:hypothetical protein n=1 Tax=Robinsoniella sp. RHS TaxID=1504536 RepID=UPI0006588102|nr:MAG: hypothetical protein RHS_1643 [Robinsoniella sp. RHS]
MKFADFTFANAYDIIGSNSSGAAGTDGLLWGKPVRMNYTKDIKRKEVMVFGFYKHHTT